MPLSHRYADKDDIPQVYVMYLEALNELKEPYNEEKALNFVLLCWAKAPCVLLLKDEEIIGFAGLNTYVPAYGDQAYLKDYMFYISPENRGIKSWRTLCKAVQEVSQKFNLPFVGEHRITGDINQHLRLIRMAGASPVSILSKYEV